MESNSEIESEKQANPVEHSTMLEEQPVISKSATEVSPDKKLYGELVALFDPKTRAYADRRRWFYAVVIMQLFVLGYLGAAKAVVLATGKQVTVRTEPIDPRDYFRGDYVALHFPFQSLTEVTNPPNQDKTVYVVLKKGAPYWTRTRVCFEPPKVQADEVFLKGQMSRNYPGGPLEAKFGIEQFYVQEGLGLSMEKEPHLKVELAVDSAGNAALSKVCSEK